MTRDAGQNREQGPARLMRGDGGPRLQIGVIFTLLGGLPVADDAVGQGAQTWTVFFRRLLDRRLAAEQVQRNDLVVVQGGFLLSLCCKGLSPR